MKSKTIVVLLALLVACVAYVVIHQAMSNKPAPPAANVDTPVLPSSIGEPVKLTIADSQGQATTFQKADGQWTIVAPLTARGNSPQIASLAQAFKDLRGQPTDNVASDVTGLDQPLWVVTVVDAAGHSGKVLVGRARPFDVNQTYVRGEGDKLYIINADIAAQLSKPLKEFRGKNALDVTVDKIADVKVSGREKFELTLGDGGEWTVSTDSASGKADAQKVRDYLAKVAAIGIEDFVDQPGELAGYGLAPGKERLLVQVQLKADKPAAPASAATTSSPATQVVKPPQVYTLALGTVTRDRAFAKLQNEQAVFQVRSALLDELQPQPMTLRDRTVLPIASYDISRIELSLPSGKADLAKVNGQWMMTSPLAGKANPDTVRKLLTDLADLKAEDFAKDSTSLAAFGLDKPLAAITLHRKGKDEMVTLLVGNKTQSAEMTFVKAASSAAVAVVPTASLQNALAAPAEYWDTTLLALPRMAKLTHIELARSDGAFELALDGGQWMMLKPVKSQVQPHAVTQIVAGLRSLTAAKIVALGSPLNEKYAKAKDAVTVKFTISEPLPPAAKPATASAPATTSASTPATIASQPTSVPATAPAAKTTTYTVRIVKVGEFAYAWLEGQKVLVVGEFPVSLFTDMTAELRNRVLTTLAADDAENIKFTAAGASLELRKAKDGWVYPADQYVKIDQEMVKTFLTDMQSLAAERFVANDAKVKAALDKPANVIEVKAGKTVIRLTIGSAGPDKTTSYGTITGIESPFVLPQTIVEKFTKTLKDFQKQGNEPPPGEGAPMPGGAMPGGPFMPPGQD